MKLKLLIALLITSLPLSLFAQGGSLTIYSESGLKFILYLNGVPQNNAPYSNLRIDGLNEPSYNAKIVFDGGIKKELEKTISVTDSVTNKLTDVVYCVDKSIKPKYSGDKVKITYLALEPVLKGSNPLADQFVIRYSQPERTRPVITNAVTTPGVNSGNGGAGFSIISSDQDNTNTSPRNTNSQTTATTTMGFGNTPAPPPVHSDCTIPMDGNSFKNARQTITQASFEDTKLQVAQSVFSSSCLSPDQVVQVCQMFGFEDSKLKFAKFAYSRTTDQANYGKVVKALSFEVSKADLNQFIANGGR